MTMHFISGASSWAQGSLFVASVSLAFAFGCVAGEPSTDGVDGAVGAGGMGTDSTITLDGQGASSSGTGGDSATTCSVDPVTGNEVCSCVALATWGALGRYGAVPGMDGQDAITAWLNANSTGMAEYFPTKPAITAETLAPFDVIILQDLRGWSFTAEEVAAFEAWVRAGGGVMALQGYSDQPAEAATTNQLVAFSGMQYAGLAGPGDISTSAANSDGCAYCLGNSDRQGGWVSAHPIAKSISLVGAFYGRSIDPGASGQPVANWGGKVAGASAEVDAGRVFLFHDEWVTYNSQWDGSALVDDCRAVDVNHSCYGVHPTREYQIAQFWYNSIKWLSGDPQCFDIRDNSIVK